jgi:major vault protein
MADERSGRDLVLAPNEFAFILDETKGNVTVYVGPNKTSLANTDKPVVFGEKTKIFDRCDLQKATQCFKTAPEGWYVILKNPATDNAHPQPGSGQNLPKLNVGRKVNLQGPISFPLWPGQMAKVIQGHHLKSNQYALVRVYDDESARSNWHQGVVKSRVDEDKEAKSSKSEDAALSIDVKTLTMGKLIIIKGTDVSFYIPPTGVEVIPDDNGSMVRNAVTLERLEYCILLDEDGNKRFLKGPDVVFPAPTETFVTHGGERKFKAIELNDQMGLHIKVITDYDDHKAGEELFITGEQMRIYYPRPEHAIIKYGDQDVHYAVAIPAGEARYVLNKKSGEIETIKGPKMFLPDPRDQVVVRRVLSPKMVSMMYPGNQEALQHNMQLSSMQINRAQITENDIILMDNGSSDEDKMVRRAFKSEDFARKTKFTPPRTLTLNTKYDGAVSMSVWTGYAVQITSKTGERKVVVGPASVILNYDESPEVVMFSTGKPKTTDRLEETVYLRVSHNKVSDIIKVDTKDLVEVDIKVSYRVNFEGEPEKWFSVENYVKFLCDHLRSMVKNAIKQIGIEEFNQNPISIVRDAILGRQDEKGIRPGRVFDENGMHVYDVEVLDVTIKDQDIAIQLKSAEQNAVSHWLQLLQEKRKLEVNRQLEEISQESLRIKAHTAEVSLTLAQDRMAYELNVELSKVKLTADKKKAELDAELTQQKFLDDINAAGLAREKSKQDQQIAFDKERLEMDISDLEARVNAWVSKAQSIQPGLIEAIQGLGDKALLEKISSNMAPLAILGGSSISDVINRLLKGTKLDGVLSENGKKLADMVRGAVANRIGKKEDEE